MVVLTTSLKRYNEHKNWIYTTSYTALNSKKQGVLMRLKLKNLDNYNTNYIQNLTKQFMAENDKKVIERYKTLTETEIKQLVVDDKWMASIERSVKTEMERISQRLTQRIKELAELYETPLPKQTTEIAELEERVTMHLEMMGFKINFS